MKALLQNRVFVIIVLLTIVVAISGGIYFVYANSAALSQRSRLLYAAQKAGTRPPNQTPSPKPTVLPTPSPTPTIVASKIDSKKQSSDDVNVLPDSQVGQFGNTFSKIELPGVVEEKDEVKEKKSSAPELPPAVVPPVPDSVVNQNLPGRVRNDDQAPTTTIIETDPQRYLFNNQAPEATAGAASINMSEHPVPNIAKNTFSPRGEYIDLAILHNATTNQQGGIDIAAAVWAPFYFQGHKLLDVGDKLLGTASAGKLRDRMLVTFDTVIFKDGRSLKLNAVAQDTDGTLGIKGFMVGDAFLQSMSSVLLDAAASFMSTFKDMTNNNTPSPFTSTSNGQQEVMNAKNGGINTAQGAAQSIAKMVAQDIEENKPYLLVIAGTRCRGYLKAYIDVSTREYGQ